MYAWVVMGGEFGYDSAGEFERAGGGQGDGDLVLLQYLVVNYKVGPTK